MSPRPSEPDVLRIAADENVRGTVVAGLRRVGVDIVSFQEAGRGGIPDDEQVTWAHGADRVVLTHDKDFLGITARTADHAGVLYCHMDKYRIGDLIRAVETLARGLETLRSRVVFL